MAKRRKYGGDKGTSNSALLKAAAKLEERTTSQNTEADGMGHDNRANIVKTIFTTIKNIIKTILGKFNDIIMKSPVSKALGRWIAVGIVILLVIALVNGGLIATSTSSRRSAAYDTKSISEKIKGGFNSVLESTKTITKTFGKKATTGIPREIEKNGRCDDVEWITMGGNNINICYKSSVEKPADLRWIIDPTNLYEYDTLPAAIKKNISEDINKLTIIIPYVNNGSSYVLSCNDAVYQDGTSAKDLFEEDTNNYCKLKTQSVNIYESKNRAPKTSNNYKGIDRYI